MRIEHYPHKLAAIYPDAASTETARQTLASAHLGDVLMVHMHKGRSHISQAIEPEQAATRNHFIVDILAGTGIGALAGIVVAAAVAVLVPSLFLNVPILGPLMVVGYIANVGMIFGAIKGLRVREGMLSGSVQDAINHGSHVLVVHSSDDVTHDRVGKILCNNTPVAATLSV